MQWFSIMPTLHSIAVYVGSCKYRQKCTLSADTVTGPCSGYVSNKSELVWD
jgi:hypothetical protein